MVCGFLQPRRIWCDYSSSDDHTFPSPENLKIFFNLLGHLYLPPTPLALSPLPFYSVLGNEGYVNYWKLFGFPCNVRDRVLHVLEAPLWFSACLHGGREPQVVEVTRLSISSLIFVLSRVRDRWTDSPHVTSPTWGPAVPCKQALR